MKQFKDFNIKSESPTFIGDKIKITKILNREIVVHSFKLENSKFNEGKCLCLQVELNTTKHVIFTGSSKLAESIKQVPAEGFPFKTVITQENEMYQFT
ncbi:MAG: hypothetical protein Q8K92_19855 [Leadbetterella sp.]|nr:hypothetical protein [Leadbetterella sp.]